jgi:hypothetical protein
VSLLTLILVALIICIGWIAFSYARIRDIFGYVECALFLTMLLSASLGWLVLFILYMGGTK